MRVLFPIAVGVLLAGCGAAPGESDGSRTGVVASRIVNGTQSSAAQDAVVLLSIGTEGQYCTGALIAPNLVLTARHCVQNTDDSTECGPYEGDIEPSSIRVSLGTDAEGKAAAARGKRSFVDAGSTICSHDLALLLLDKDVPGAQVAAIRFGKVGKGETTTTVGYGDDGSGKSTTSRFQRDSLKIDAVGPASATYTTKSNQKISFIVHAGEIATGESTCFGDSGGPLFDAQDRIIGITSRGLDRECVDRPSIFSDLASHQTMIRDAAEVAGHPLAIDETPSDAESAPAATDDAAGDGSTNGGKSGTANRATSSTLTPQESAGCAVGTSTGARRGSWLALACAALVLAVARRRREASRR